MIARRSILLFASGDFAFNLYWQSINLYLLFFYIDVLALPPATAGLVFMVGALWDGVADLLTGVFAERTGVSYARMIGWLTVPLGTGFVWAFWGGMTSVGGLIAAQVLFRSFYAATNVPYAAWTGRLSAHSATRTMLTGLRMTFGAAAAAAVAMGLPALARLTASSPVLGYPRAAAMLAGLATPILLLMAWRVPEPRRPAQQTRRAEAPKLAALLRNRAFMLLNIAAAAGGAAAALLVQSAPYYFRYVAHDPGRGAQALAAMGVASALALPLWTALATRIGARAAWLAATALALASLAAAFVLGHTTADPTLSTVVPIVLAAIAFAGINLTAWSLLPDSLDWGEIQGQPRVEALAFGAFAFLQKAALAGAGMAIGAVYASNGFNPGVTQTAGTIASIRWLMLAGPGILILASALAIAAHPLRRDTLATLGARRDAARAIRPA